MRISFEWLKEYVDAAGSPEDLAHRLTMAGLEVEAVHRLGEGIQGVVVAEVLEVRKHPHADRLSVCQVSAGQETLSIVCGAPNVRPRMKAALARVGATLPDGHAIKKSRIRGVESHGMLCSEKELNLSALGGSEGIFALPDDLPVGEDIRRALGLEDTLLEISVTPNRPDCLSLVGVAREVAAVTGNRLRVPTVTLEESGEPAAKLASVEVLAPELCRRYAARVVMGVTLGHSPRWLMRRLEAAGLRPINNVVDVTNYVLLELGHPLHAFDYDRLEGHRIVVRGAKAGERFTTLDGVSRTLTEEMLLICDGQGPVALAGVMGGLDSGVTEGTRNVLLESAYFQPASIRRTSRRLGLSTESSYRFERGTDPEGLILALDRAAQLLAELAGGRVAPGRLDVYPRPFTRKRIVLRPSRVCRVLGVDVSNREIQNTLERLSLSVHPGHENTLEVEVPSHRVDLNQEVDLVEEVGRLHGYENIPTSLPSGTLMAEAVEEPAPWPAMRQALLGQGWNEVVSYSFMDIRDLERLRIVEGDLLRKTIALRNPLSTEQAHLRTLLLPGLLRALRWNVHRGVERGRLFEWGRVFHPREGEKLPWEPVRIGGVWWGSRERRFWDRPMAAADFFDVKGAVESLIGILRIGPLRRVRMEPCPEVPYLEPGQGARVLVGENPAGILGRLHAESVEAWGLPQGTLCFDLDGDVLQAAMPPRARFQPLPAYPAVLRDMAILVDTAIPYAAVLEAIQKANEPILTRVECFDLYEGPAVPAGKKSLAFRLTYRSPKRTLTDEEVNEAHRSVERSLADRVGATVRGESVNR